MNDYKKPVIELVEFDVKDILITSPGTETTPKDEEGFWDFAW